MNQKILIIDDETDFCLIMNNYFIKKGHTVLYAHTLNDGLELLEKNQPDILFLDNNLPDGYGWDSVESIVEIVPQIRVYLVSAHRSISTFHYKNKNVVIWEKPISVSLLNTVC